jgi:hypothetical protein
MGLYYRILKHQSITKDVHDRRDFILAKKIIALFILLAFVVICLRNLVAFCLDAPLGNAFESLYTLLIFSDVLIVLISLRYSSSYHVAFRNSGFAVSTVLIRLALIAPVWIGAVLGFSTALFALGIMYSYNAFSQDYSRRG